MSRPVAWTLALALALVGGVARMVLAPSLRMSRLHARSLPGFSVALPDGKVVREDRDYARGTILVHIDDAFLDVVVGAAWQPSDGTPLSTGELEALAQVFANGVGEIPKGKASPVSVDGPDGKPLGSMRVGDNMWMTMSPCGTRDVIITTIASRGSERLHRHVVRSLACTPDPAGEATVRGVGIPLALDLPGWRAMERSPTYLQLSDGKAMVSLTSVPANIENAALAQVLGPMAKSQGLTANFAAPRDGRVAFSMTVGSDTVVGWARVFHCPTASEALMAFADNDAAAQALWTRVGNARCLKPGEAAQTWPDSAKQ